MLLATFVAYLLICMGLLLYLRHAAVESIRGPALAKANVDADLSMREPRGSLSRTPLGLARWLGDGPYDDEFDADARSLRGTPAGDDLVSRLRQAVEECIEHLQAEVA